VLGHAQYMKTIHGGKSKHDGLNAQKIAVWLRVGMLPRAYAYPATMCATRDLLRRLHLVCQRHLAGHRDVAFAYQVDVGDGVMRGTKGPGGNPGGRAAGHAGHTVDPRRLEGLGEGHIRPDGGQATRQPGCTTPQLRDVEPGERLQRAADDRPLVAAEGQGRVGVGDLDTPLSGRRPVRAVWDAGCVCGMVQRPRALPLYHRH
jgi:hypothetical protein